MFTGIVEEVGTVKRIARGARSATIEVSARTVLSDAHVGDSIAVDGVCLTVTSFTDGSFTADVMHETLDRSSLGMLGAGDHVNLERAMAAGGRFGGHIVSGHIDGTGCIASTRRDDTAVWYEVSCDESLLRYIVEKGSIAIDGISLTVARVGAGGFAVSTIPHTNEATTLSRRREGDTVNLECDIVGKYVERLLAGGADTPYADGTAHTPRGGITLDFLAENGF